MKRGREEKIEEGGGGKERVEGREQVHYTYI